MAKKKYGGGGSNGNPLSVFKSFAEAGRAAILHKALDFYHYSHQTPLAIYLASRLLTMAKRTTDDVLIGHKTNRSVLDVSPEKYIIAKLLDVDEMWAFIFLSVFGGSDDACEFNNSGDADIPLKIAQHLMISKYRFVQHPLKSFETPIHPKRQAKLLAFIYKDWK